MVRPESAIHDVPEWHEESVQHYESVTARIDPIVTVVIPAYNMAAYLPAALESIAAQTFRGYEIIVVNDGSTDTPALEKVLEQSGERVAYVRQENRGPGAARNTGIQAARGEFIAFLDADDMWLPQYLAEQLGVLRQDPGIDLHYMDAELIGDSLLAGRTYMETLPSRGPVTVESLLRNESNVLTSTVVTRRQCLVDVGLFDETLSHCEDFDLWVRMAYTGSRLAYQGRVLARRRLHPNSLTADPVRFFNMQVVVYRKIQTTLNLPERLQPIIDECVEQAQANADLERGKHHLLAGDYVSARAAFESAGSYYATAKLRTLLIGLRILPRTVRRLYEMTRWGRARRIQLRRAFRRPPIRVGRAP